jgi:large subunit ribosomal protein L23
MTTNTVLKPRISEKSYKQSILLNTYIFDVPLKANKITIKNAVQEQFGVAVTKVTVTLLKGKYVRSNISKRKAVTGLRQDRKKAYVTLKTGDSLPFFVDKTEEQKTKGAK